MPPGGAARRRAGEEIREWETAAASYAAGPRSATAGPEIELGIWPICCVGSRAAIGLGEIIPQYANRVPIYETIRQPAGFVAFPPGFFGRRAGPRRGRCGRRG